MLPRSMATTDGIPQNHRRAPLDGLDVTAFVDFCRSTTKETSKKYSELDKFFLFLGKIISTFIIYLFFHRCSKVKQATINKLNLLAPEEPATVARIEYNEVPSIHGGVAQGAVIAVVPLVGHGEPVADPVDLPVVPGPKPPLIRIGRAHAAHLPGVQNWHLHMGRARGACVIAAVLEENHHGAIAIDTLALRHGLALVTVVVVRCGWDLAVGVLVRGGLEHPHLHHVRAVEQGAVVARDDEALGIRKNGALHKGRSAAGDGVVVLFTNDLVHLLGRCDRN